MRWRRSASSGTTTRRKQGAVSVEGERLEWLAEQRDAEAARDVEAHATRGRVPILVRFANGYMELFYPEDSPGSEEGSSEGVDAETDSDVMEVMYDAGVWDRPQSSQSSQSDLDVTEGSAELQGWSSEAEEVQSESCERSLVDITDSEPEAFAAWHRGLVSGAATIDLTLSSGDEGGVCPGDTPTAHRAAKRAARVVSLAPATAPW